MLTMIKRILSIDSIKTYAHGTNEEIKHKKVIKCKYDKMIRKND